MVPNTPKSGKRCKDRCRNRSRGGWDEGKGGGGKEGGRQEKRDIFRRETEWMEEKGMEGEIEGSKVEGFAISISCFKRDEEWQKLSGAFVIRKEDIPLVPHFDYIASAVCLPILFIFLCRCKLSSVNCKLAVFTPRS